jgi:hypothetical protein
MIYHLACAVSDRLHLRGFPACVRYDGTIVGSRGSESLSVSFFPDCQKGDTIGDVPSGSRANGNRGLSINEGAACVIAASSSHPHAMAEDHQALCRALRNAVICAVCDWAVASRFGFPSFGEARFLEAGEVEYSGDDARGPRGNDAVYVLRFAVRSAIVDASFEGEPPPLGNPVASVADPVVTLIQP